MMTRFVNLPRGCNYLCGAQHSPLRHRQPLLCINRQSTRSTRSAPALHLCIHHLSHTKSRPIWLIMSNTMLTGQQSLLSSSYLHTIHWCNEKHIELMTSGSLSHVDNLYTNILRKRPLMRRRSGVYLVITRARRAFLLSQKVIPLCFGALVIIPDPPFRNLKARCTPLLRLHRSVHAVLTTHHQFPLFSDYPKTYCVAFLWRGLTAFWLP